MIRILVGLAVLLSSNVFVHAEAECSRSMLQAAAASYIAAQEAGDLSKMSLAENVKYFEDMIDYAGFGTPGEEG